VRFEGEEDDSEEKFEKNCGRDFMNKLWGSWKGIDKGLKERVGDRVVGPYNGSEFQIALERGDFDT